MILGEEPLNDGIKMAHSGLFGNQAENRNFLPQNFTENSDAAYYA